MQISFINRFKNTRKYIGNKKVPTKRNFNEQMIDKRQISGVNVTFNTIVQITG